MPSLKKDKPYKFKEDTINPDAFKQGKYWYDSKGKRYKIADMNLMHTINAMALLVRDYHRHEPEKTKLYKAMAKHRLYLSTR